MHIVSARGIAHRTIIASMVESQNTADVGAEMHEPVVDLDPQFLMHKLFCDKYIDEESAYRLVSPQAASVDTSVWGTGGMLNSYIYANMER